MIWKGITFTYTKAAREQLLHTHKQQVIFLCILIFVALGRRQDEKNFGLILARMLLF
jgi:hypothetical protein